MITDKHFIDWESDTFGYGYGTGEAFILVALKTFFSTLKLTPGTASPSYDYRELEAALGELPAWLLINTLLHADLFEYGTSPRYAWLTAKGKLLKEYVDAKTVDELYELATGHDENYSPCYPTHCNCGAVHCANPLWRPR